MNFIERERSPVRRARIRCLLPIAATLAGACPELLQAQEQSSSSGWTLSVLAIGGESFRPRGRGVAETVGPVIEAGKPISSRFEIALSLHPFIRINQPETVDGQGQEQLTAAALDLLVRWFPFPRAWPVEPFIEAAEGVFYADGSTPAGASQFNFLTQAGLGLCFRADAQWSVIAGYRWFHISNAGLDDSNPAWNFNAVILGARVRLGSSRPGRSPAAVAGRRAAANVGRKARD